MTCFGSLMPLDAALLADDEIEVSLFGPGFGESAAIHIGGGDWIIVDTLIDEYSSTLIPLEYLQSIGVDTATQVKLVVGTHFDADHVMGLSATVAACISASFVTSLVLNERQVLRLIRSNSRDPEVDDRFAGEYAETLSVLQQRAQTGTPTVPPITWAAPNTTLFQRPSSGACPRARVTSLAPSHASVTMTLQALGNVIPVEGFDRKPTPFRVPNHSSVVVWVEVGDVALLLGSDLEETGHSGTGWTAICDSGARPEGRAEIFKVPHHGSSNGHHERVWSELLVDEPVAVLTAWRLGAHSLPTATDMERICEHAADAYLTSPPAAPRSLKRNPAVEKTMKESVIRINALAGRLGHVRLRRHANGTSPWAVELQTPADRLRS